MGFSKVYKTLQEVFPEVDSRILRAVSIEHCKDPDAAVEAVLNEVIPCLTQRNKPPSTSGQSGVTSSGQSGDTVKSSEAVMDAKEAAPQNEASLLDNAKDSDELQDGLAFHEASCEHNKTVEDTDGDSLQHFHDAVGGDHVAFEGDEIGTAVSKSSEVSAEKSCQVTFPTSNDVDMVGDDVHGVPVNNECASPVATSSKVTKSDEAVVALDQLRLPTNCVDSHNTLNGTDNSASDDSTALIHKRVHEEESLVDRQDMKHPESQLESSNVNVQTLSLSGSESSIELVAPPDVHDFELEKVEISDSDMVVNEVESMPNPIVTASGQICSVDLLEDMITEAKNNKKTLFLAMESVICLMREVELHEEAAQQVNQEAVKGGVDLLVKVEELKEMLQHAKEANDMHAGEVHGEKAILATEFKELQSRLLGLADERDKSLAVLEEMRQTLELRMAAAEKELKDSEQERQGKELLARKALADQELIMERVVQESNILKQEAEENAKLRDFLVDRGRVVDTLQGEISVICKDVKVLKEKFDERVPLSKSLSSSQTSCILASSSSSLKSVVPDQVPDPANSLSYHEEHQTFGDVNSANTLDAPEKTDASSSYREEHRAFEVVNSEIHNKDLLDDEWEICDNRELCV